MGPQVQLNMQPGRSLGGLFELHGRGWLRKVDPAVNTRLLEGLQWIDCDVAARGPVVEVSINGEQIVYWKEEQATSPLTEGGFFALQIHGGGFCTVLVQELAVRRLD
jgi:hypothetical protein